MFEGSHGEFSHHGVGEKATLEGEDEALTLLFEVERNEAVIDQSIDLPAGFIAEDLGIESTAKPALQQDAFGESGRFIEGLEAMDRRLARIEPVSIRRRVLDVPPPVAIQMRMRTRADAPPIGTFPVQLVVMTTRGLIKGPVGEFIPTETGRFEKTVGKNIFVGHLVIIGQGNLATRNPACQRGALFDDEGLGAHVVGFERDCMSETSAPIVHGFPRRSINKVDAELVETSRTCPADRVGYAFGPMRPVESCQDMRDSGLDAEGDPVDAAFAQR